ncbi:MAG TPA: outer membrane beta-barrel protein [Phaeodactylibacter sp.]|nr:outer membrane beta-barrel protein [Phaeodactylibacter sp.]
MKLLWESSLPQKSGYITKHVRIAVKKLGLIAGFDIGAQQAAKGSNRYNTWYSPVLIARYAISEKVAIAGRAEYYSDESEVIIPTGTPNGFQTFGYSVNLDVKVRERVLWRLEGRVLDSNRDPIFTDSDGNPTERNVFVGTSLSISM